MKENINLDTGGFPQSYEFIIPVLKVLKEGNYTEEEISIKLIEYFNLNEQQINQKVVPKNSNNEPNTKLKSHTHFAILDFERFGCCVKQENKTYSIEYRGRQILDMGIKKLKKTELEKLVKRLDLIEILRVLFFLKLDFSFIYLTTVTNAFIDVLPEHFKTFVKKNYINDYDNQGGGVGKRKTKDGYTFINEEKINFTLSLYRTTRYGEIAEPRINFIQPNSRRVWDSIKPGLLLFTIINEKVYLLNLSDDATLKSLFSQKGEPYETLKKESDRKLNENVKLFFKQLKKLNDKRYVLLNSACPNINSILKKEGFFSNNSQKYEYNKIKFEVLNEEDEIFEKKSDNDLFNLIMNGEEDYVKEYNIEYFVNNPYLELSSINPEGNSPLKIDYESGLLKVVDDIFGDVLTLDLENILDNIEEEFCLLYKNIITNYCDEYVFFEKILYYSQPNFCLLCLLGEFFKKTLDIDIGLILYTEFNDNVLSCRLRLDLKDEKILKALLYPNVFNLKDEIKSF